MTLLSELTVLPAYVGPGLGLGAVALILGLLLSVVLAIVGVVWYPIKRAIRALRGSGAPDHSAAENETGV